ncbi:hypothetical protein G6F42_010358 [Rhizopus arrhizus]|nr:hypothetical protein G6F42_010358 [Rhizopus arrhizus]
MSGSHISIPPVPPIPPQSSSMSDVAQYLIQERAKSIPIAPYEPHQSLRIWLKNVTQQAIVHGITGIDICAPHLTKYMPLVMQQWIPTFAPTIIIKWLLLTESLLHRFGLPEEEDNRRLLQQLKNCKQQPNESVCLHAAKWEHLLNLISDTYTQDTQITYFIQSLNQRDTKLTLTSLVAALNITNVSEVIIQAINHEVRAKLLEEPETIRSSQSDNIYHSADPTPMDADYLAKTNNNSSSRKRQQQQLCAYDKQATPICDYCYAKHRAVDHNKIFNNKHNKNNGRTQEMESLPEPEEQLTSSFSVDISHFATYLCKLPRSTVYINHKPTSLLWDTSADINGIQYELFTTMNIGLNKQESIRYRDVNSNIKSTCGTAIIPVLGQQVHVIEGHNNSEDSNVTLTYNNKTVIIHLVTVDEARNIQAIDQAENRQTFTDFVLEKFDGVIAKNPDRPSVTHLIEFTIDTGDSLPIYTKPCIFRPEIQTQINDKLEAMVDSGLLKVQFSQWGSQVRPVDKPDGSMRVCGNYIAVNAVTKPIKYPFPNIHYLLQSVGQAKIFSKLDLAQGYFQIPIKQEHKPRSRRTVEEHKQHLCQVLTQLEAANLSIKLSKSQFILDSVEYLGFIVSEHDVSASSDKIKPILNYQAPTNLTELDRFLGMMDVYQHFISQYQLKTESLRRLKKKSTPFVWNKEQEQAFRTLKQDLCLLPTLKQPDFSRPFELHTDAATSAGIAVILCQKYDGTPYPLAFAPRALTIHEQKYSVREQECLSIIFKDISSRIWRWTMFLQSYQFEIIHVPGKANSAADALSRHSMVPAIQVVQETFAATHISWVQAQDDDPVLSDIKQHLNEHSAYVVINKILYRSFSQKGSINHSGLFLVVPKEYVQDICKIYHNSPFGGHFGSKKTKAKIKQQLLWWSNMDEDIHKSKVFPFLRVALDFFGPLPATVHQNKYVLVVIDCFSRYVELYPVISTTQEELVKTLFNRFIFRHRVPQEILTDGSPPFNSMFFTQLTTLLGSQNLFVPPYHPQSNGTAERFMAILRQMILTYTNQAVIKNEWDQHLRIIQFVSNSTVHEGTGYAPFYLVHGRHPNFPLVNLGNQQLYEHYQSPSQSFTVDLQNRLNLAFEMVDNMTKTTDYKDKENLYKIGDNVLLFNQSLSSSKKPRKLMFDWLGPFIVTSVNSKSTVNLKDALSNKSIINVHISSLKKFNDSV